MGNFTKMRKKKLIEKLIKRTFEEFDRRYQHLTDLINKYEVQVLMLTQKVERVLNPYDKFMTVTNFEQEMMQLRGYIQEVESKISNKWYNHVGLVEKLDHYFSEPISNNRKDIEKILERLGECRD